MRLFELSTDSTSDLYAQELQDWNIASAPLTFVLSDGKKQTEHYDNFKDYSDYENFFSHLKQGKTSKTSMLNETAHYEHFEKMVSNGAKNVLHTSLSVGLSPTYENAVRAAKKIMSKHKDVNIVCVQSNSASIGQAMLIRIAMQMRNNGKTVQETADYLNGIKHKIKIYVMVDSLQHLKRGGRISGAKAAIGTVLSVKPVLSFDENGKLDVIAKINGTKKAVKTISDMLNEHKINPNHKQIYLVHTGVNAQVNLLANEIEKVSGIAPELRIMGPVIGSHVGPGGMGFGYIS